MTKSEAKAATIHLRAILALLLPMATDQASSAAAELRRAVGALSDDAERQISSSAFGGDLLACFVDAHLAGATFAAMGRIESYASSVVPSGNASIAVIVSSLRFATIQRTRIVAATTYRSRQDVESVQAILNASFGTLIEYAADSGEQEVYRALVALQAATTRDLQQRSRPLPRMITYALGSSLPTLSLANRLYGDADRADELRDENRVPHPLFAPPTGQALST